MAVRLVPQDLTVTPSPFRTLYEGFSFDPTLVSLPPSLLFGVIGGVAGGLCLFVIVHWSLIFCIAVCCMRRRQCRTSSPIDPAGSYSPNDGGGVRCNLDTLYSPRFGVSGQCRWEEACSDSGSHLCIISHVKFQCRTAP